MQVIFEIANIILIVCLPIIATVMIITGITVTNYLTVIFAIMRDFHSRNK